MATPTYANRPTCACFLEWFVEFQAECIRRGYRSRPFRIFQLIGNAKQSAGYHASGAVADTELLSADEWRLAREMGAGGWNRYAWQGFDDEHHHLALYGCPHLATGAAWQLGDLLDGNNGLSGKTRGRDDGPVRPVRTWQQGLEWLRARSTATAVSTSTLKGDPEMLTVQWNKNNAVLTFGPQQVAYETDQHHADVLRDVTGSADPGTGTFRVAGDDEISALMENYGVPQFAVDAVLAGTAFQIDGRRADGKTSKGHFWSWGLESFDRLAKVAG